jgi:hypothetical protein
MPHRGVEDIARLANTSGDDRGHGVVEHRLVLVDILAVV